MFAIRHTQKRGSEGQMNSVDEVPQPFYPEIIATLADLSRMAQQVLVASTAAMTETFALALLGRLLHLCRRQRGALLLATQYHTLSKRSFWPSLAQRKTLRVLAREALGEDDLFALLATFTGSEEIQISSEPGWTICQHLLPVPEGESRKEPLSGEVFSTPLSSTLSFFLLTGTDTTNTSTPQQAL